MSTQKPVVPAEMPPEAPAELIAKREPLAAELEKAAKATSGTLQQVLRKMQVLLSQTKPGSSLDGQLYQDVKDAFTRYAKDTAAGPAPASLMQAVDWLQAYLSARGFAASAEPAASTGAPASAAPRAAVKGGDAFDSGDSSARARTLTGEVPLSPEAAKSLDPKSEQQQMESFKAWMKNPSLGKLKG